MKMPRLWIALDGLADNEDETLALVKELDKVPGNFGFKVNLNWLVRHGFRESRKILPSRPCFADMKMWNGARTMAGAFLEAHRAGMDVINAYALAGGYTGQGEELAKAIATFRARVEKTNLLVYAVTVLTHYNDDYCHRQFCGGLAGTVRRFAEEGVAAQADGIILPGTQLGAVTDLDVWKMTPGLRSKEYKDDRHMQEVTAEEVAKWSKVAAVCGGPITNSDDPPAFLQQLLQILDR